MPDNLQVKSAKLLKYGKKQLGEKGVETQATTIREVLDDITNIQASGGYGEYNIESVPLGDGTQKYIITTASEKPKDMLQARVDTYGFNYLFYQYQGTEIDYINRLDTSNVQDFSSAFEYSKLQTAPYINTSNGTNFYRMFGGCSRLTTIPNLNTSNGTNFSSMFEQCTALTTIPELDTSKSTNFYAMFSGCKALSSVPNLNTSNGTKFGSMFLGCTALTTIPELDTSKATDVTSMFYNCENLITITKIDLFSVSSNLTTSIIYNCKNLENINVWNIKVDFLLTNSSTWGHKINKESLINIIQQLWDYSSGTRTYKFTMGYRSKLEDIYVKLVEPTEEMIANDPNIIYKKPCVVCESTDEGAMLITEYATSKMWSIS